MTAIRSQKRIQCQLYGMLNYQRDIGFTATLQRAAVKLNDIFSRMSTAKQKSKHIARDRATMRLTPLAGADLVKRVSSRSRATVVRALESRADSAVTRVTEILRVCGIGQLACIRH
jgi:hypothetical protein